MKIRLSLFTVLLLAMVARPLMANDCSDKHGLALQVIGSDILMPEAMSPGYVVWQQGRARVVINMPAGTTSYLLQNGQLAAAFDTAILTRTSADATSDLPLLVSQAKHQGRKRSLTIYGPHGSRLMSSTVNMVRGLFDSKRGSYRHLGSVLSPLDNQSFKLRAQDVSSERIKSLARKYQSVNGIVNIYKKHGLQIRALDTGTKLLPSLAWHIQANNGTGITITDAPAVNNQALDALAKNSRLLITHISKHKTGLTPAMAGSLAYRSDSRQLLIAYRETDDEETRNRDMTTIKSKFSGLAGFVQTGLCITLAERP